jgi:tetratricopeptide (TPR) repeat protein
MAGLPKEWNAEAQRLWDAGRKPEAVRACLDLLDNAPRPDGQVLIQAAHYLFLLGEFATCAAVLRKGLDHYPDNMTVLLSLGLALSRANEHQRALVHLRRYLELGGRDAGAFDGLATSSFALGDEAAARRFGTQALDAKDEATSASRGIVELTKVSGCDGRRSIISFSLWGSRPRYLRGALQNVLATRDLYPGWICRFVIDESVDKDFLAVLRDEGAELILDESGDDSLQHRLTRRFAVADDPAVGRFLVRDCDSVIGAREAAAVSEWVASGLPFHVMRDWWSHTDPILAGLWGGIAGAFPRLMDAVRTFRAMAPETSNWDQWFLRDHVWPAIRDRAMIHDRLFDSHGARPWPFPDPEDGSHVGQNEFAVDQAGQAAMLQPYAERAPALMVPKPVRLQFRTS